MRSTDLDQRIATRDQRADQIIVTQAARVQIHTQPTVFKPNGHIGIAAVGGQCARAADLQGGRGGIHAQVVEDIQRIFTLQQIA
ncbi:hypothetical protein D9M72_641040 [compost metagenome]